jgi:hypothetical protein
MMETVDAEELAQNAVESMVAIMFDVPLDEIDHFSFEAPPEHPNGVRVRLLLKSGKAREHFVKNDDAWTCTVEIAGITGIA